MTSFYSLNRYNELWYDELGDLCQEIIIFSSSNPWAAFQVGLLLGSFARETMLLLSSLYNVLGCAWLMAYFFVVSSLLHLLCRNVCRPCVITPRSVCWDPGWWSFLVVEPGCTPGPMNKDNASDLPWRSVIVEILELRTTSAIPVAVLSHCSVSPDESEYEDYWSLKFKNIFLLIHG